MVKKHNIYGNESHHVHYETKSYELYRMTDMMFYQIHILI